MAFNSGFTPGGSSPVWDNPSEGSAWMTGPWRPANNSNVAFVRSYLENSLLLMNSEYQVRVSYPAASGGGPEYVEG